MISRAYKVEIRPSALQKKRLWEWGNKMRGIWNWITEEDQYRWLLSFLGDETREISDSQRSAMECQARKTQERWDKRGRTLGAKLIREDGKALSFYARVTGENAQPWMKGVPSSAISQLDRTHKKAWQNYMKSKGRGGGPPRPHKNKGRVSFSVQGVRFVDDWSIKIPVPVDLDRDERFKLAEPIKLCRPIGWMLSSGQPRPWKPSSGDVCTISCTAGRWYASFPAPEHHPPCPRDEQRLARGLAKSDIIAVDLRTTGCRAWDGEKTWWYQLPESIAELDRRIDAQRQVLSLKIEVRKKRPGQPRSKRYMRELDVLRRLCDRQARIRRDWLDKTTYDLVLRGKTIVCELLKVKEMTESASGTEDEPGKNVELRATWNRRVLSASFYAFRCLLERKGEWYGAQVVSLDPAFTSMDCSCCGSRNRLRKIGAEVMYRCRSCGMTMMQSENACRNIYDRFVRGNEADQADVGGISSSRKSKATKKSSAKVAQKTVDLPMAGAQG